MHSFYIITSNLHALILNKHMQYQCNDDSANGRINTKEQAKEKLSKWFKSNNKAFRNRI